MTSERIVKLDSLSFNWGKNFPHPPTWDEMFDKLSAYQSRFKTCNVACSSAKPTGALARWAAYQRMEYKRYKSGRASLLSPDQIEKLDGIGMNWNGPKL